MPPSSDVDPTLPENVLSLDRSGRQWSGVRVEVTRFRCAGRVLHSLQHQESTRLNVLLDATGSARCEPRLQRHRPGPVAPVHRHLNFVPAGVELFGYSADVRQARDATLLFDLEVVAARLGDDIDPRNLGGPRLGFADDRIWTMVRLLADVDGREDPSTELYGDSLSLAILSVLFEPVASSRQRTGGLAQWQLRRVVESMEAQLPESLSIDALARLCGLSSAHFSRAFKTSTGMPPYRWQLEARIRRAQHLLLSERPPLAQVAEATGFADAVHFGRTFRRLVGVTPAAWRREHER